MASTGSQAPANADGSPFDRTRPSPLPSLPTRDPDTLDPVALAEQNVVRAEALGMAAGERAAAWLSVADAWLSLDAVGPAHGAVRRAVAVCPDRADALERLAALEARVGRHRESAEVRGKLARMLDTPAAWESAVRAWLRAGEPTEAERALGELLRRADNDPRARALELTMARGRGGGGETLVARLLDAAIRARRHDDREGWRAYAADAWLESRGHRGGEALTEALAASGHPRAAVYISAESAARGLAEDPTGDGDAARLLVRSAKLAETAAMPGEATAAWTVRALLGGAQARDAREALRDLLAERGRSVDLAARLRADARRAPVEARAAAWKGVAAIEIPQQPARAAYALAEALRLRPEDTEARDLLDALAANRAAEDAVRDALWGLVAEGVTDGPVRAHWCVWLGDLEERGGDPAAASVAYTLAESAGAVGLARVAAPAAALKARAEQTLQALEAMDDGGVASAERLLAGFGATPGAFVGLRLAAKVLGGIALHDGRVAGLWVRVIRRAGDPGQLVTVLRRVATRCTATPARVSAAVACAEILDLAEGPMVAAELLTQLLDELPEEPAAAAALAALAEHSGDATLARDTLRVLARASSDPWERDVLTRFTGESEGIFTVFASCLAEPTASRDRTTSLARLHDLIGDCTTLLAARTRALLAQPGLLDDGVDVARRFAAFDPSSPEATIAWFGAASLAGDPAQVMAAATAVLGSLASARDVAAVVRTALSRLGTLGAEHHARDLALDAARAGMLFDRPLRTTVVDLAVASGDTATGLRLLESVAAGAVDHPDEHEAALRGVAGLYRLGAHAVGELRALDRVLSVAPGDASVRARMMDLSARIGDGAIACRWLASKLEATTGPTERRVAYLAWVAGLLHTVPPRTDEAIAALDGYAMDARTDTAQGDVVRVLLSLGRADLAVDRLARWTAEALSDQGAAWRAMAGAEVAHEVLHESHRALGMLRGVLGRTSNIPDVLLLAERIAVEAHARTEMLAIYDDLGQASAGEHGRHAIAYRRAAYLERVGDHPAALREHIALFQHAPALGASFSAIERIVETTGDYDVLARSLTLLAMASPAAETRARFYLRAAEVVRTRGRDLRTATGYELQALRALPDEATDALVVEHARLLRASDPEGAREIFNALMDDALAAGNQAWDDDLRRSFALRAAELAVTEADDPYRLAAAVALYLRGHKDLPAGREAIFALLNRTAASGLLRAAAEAVPAMAVSKRTSEVPPPENLAGHTETVDLATARSPESKAPTAKVPVGDGDDTAVAAMAERLASDEDTRDEALAIQRRRVTEDPARLDALVGMASLYRAMQMPLEADVVDAVHAVLSGRAVSSHPTPIQDLAEGIEGVERVLAPSGLALWSELGGILWEARGTPWRREATRVTRESERPWIDPASDASKMVSVALRLLELPRSTPWALRDDVSGGITVVASHPPGVAMAVTMARDTPRARYRLGRALEGTRPGNVLAATLNDTEGEGLVAAVHAAFGELSDGARVDASVAHLATLLQDGIPARAQRRVRDIVGDFGRRLAWTPWRTAVEAVCSRAGMLLSGDFGVAVGEILARDTDAPPDPRQAIQSHEPLRELTRFATSKEYLLLRWQIDEATRRRR